MLESHIQHQLERMYDESQTAQGELQNNSSIYWMDNLVRRHLTGPSVYRELIFKTCDMVDNMDEDDKLHHLPMLINVICQRRMLSINETGRIPLQVLMVAEMTGLYQNEKMADPARAQDIMTAACLEILIDPDQITCCDITQGNPLAALPRAGGEDQGALPRVVEDAIDRNDPQALFDEVLSRVRADRDAKPMVTPLAAYTCAVTAVAKKGMVSQQCMDKIIDGVKSDLGRQLVISTDLVRRYHDRFPITLTRENVAGRMKTIEDILPEENIRLKIIIRQAALSGLTKKKLRFVF